jgi:chaperonin GroEL
MEADGDIAAGVAIVKRALTEPCRQIAANAGLEGSVVCESILAKSSVKFGFNALTGEYEDLVKAGVIDPTKVVRSALENAVSIGSLILTTEALVAEVPQKETPAPPTPDY